LRKNRQLGDYGKQKVSSLIKQGTKVVESFIREKGVKESGKNKIERQSKKFVLQEKDKIPATGESGPERCAGRVETK